MKNPLECHKPTRMPKMILVFYASLAPRGYGRTSPRLPRVYLPFVANLAQLAAPGLATGHVYAVSGVIARGGAAERRLPPGGGPK